VTERPQNLRPARSADRTHNSHRYHPYGNDGGAGGPTATAIRAYRGSHRAEHLHGAADGTGEFHRSTRVGRHHADQEHQQNRW
jgi:hypothetical protein